MPHLSVMIKPVSGSCNMDCSYCFCRNERSGRRNICPDRMTEKTQEQVIKKILQLADRECTILFQGGEPTLAGIDFYRNWLAYENFYNRKKIKIFHLFQTNGYALDEKWCSFLAEHQFLTGLSMDGIPSVHNYYRKDKNGEGTYFRVLESAERLQKSDADFSILTVVNRKSAAAIWKIYAKYKKMGFRQQQYIACLDPVGEVPGEQEYALTPELYGRFLIELFELWMVDLKNGCEPYICQFENYIGILMGLEPESCEQRGFCSPQMVVESDGSVYPCDFYTTDQYLLGNLTGDSLEMIVERWRKLEFAEQSLRRDPKCGTCRYGILCRGGCRRYREGQAEGGGKNRFCESYRMFFDVCLPRMKEVAESRMNRQRLFSPGRAENCDFRALRSACDILL